MALFGKFFGSLANLAENTALRKSHAVHNRLHAVQKDSERPTEIFERVCAELAEALATEGFKYAKSARRVTRRNSDLKFQISFQSSHRNVADEYVALWINGTIFSRQYARWLNTSGLPCSAAAGERYVAGGQIGNLKFPQEWLEWNLADKHHRPSAQADALAAIRALVLPYFARFDDLKALTAELLAKDIASFDVPNSVLFLLCFAGREAAQAAGCGFLRRRPELGDAYAHAIARFTRDGAPSTVTGGYAEQLATVAVATGLRFQL